MKKNNKNVFPRTSENTKPNVLHIKKKTCWSADKVPAITVNNCPVLLVFILLRGERGPLFFFLKSLLNKTPKHQLSFYSLSIWISQIKSQENGVKYFSFKCLNVKYWSVSTRAYWWLQENIKYINSRLD